MKPKYEKPMAMGLGETVKGSGECNTGSAVDSDPDGIRRDYCSRGLAAHKSCSNGGFHTVGCGGGDVGVPV